jgi:hypothetical protein
MHRIVAHAHLAPGPRDDKLEVPMLATMLRDGWSVSRDEVDDDALSTPLEHAWARAHGIAVVEGQVPIARASMRNDGLALDDEPWALVSPVHAHVALDHVTIEAPRDIGLDEFESRALFDAVQPWFDSDGHRLVYGHAHRWYVSHPQLATLATASIERTGGEGIERWLPRGAHARAWQRLQNECQMLLHNHPVNDAREARGVKPVNSLWLSGTGAATALRDDVAIDERLRDAVDAASLRAAWAALDREAIAPIVASAGADDRLTLCGTRASVTLAPAPRRAWWQRFSRPASTDSSALLRTL